MPDILLSYEPQLRLLAFVGVFAIMATWEFLAPRRRRTIGRSARWPGNLAVVALDTLLVRIVFPTTAVIRWWYGRPTATSASSCPGGTGCWAPIGRNRPQGMKA